MIRAGIEPTQISLHEYTHRMGKLALESCALTARPSNLQFGYLSVVAIYNTKTHW
jgi:hypothetical protein